MSIINERLRISRENAKITQEEMAKYCKVSLRSIGNYEKNGHPVDSAIILSYAEKCKESAAYLLTGERTDYEAKLKEQNGAISIIMEKYSQLYNSVSKNIDHPKTEGLDEIDKEG